MANGDAGQLYIDWLYSYFRQLYMTGDGTYGDPTPGATTGILWGKEPTMAITLLNEAADLIDAGAWGSTREFSLPLVGEFYTALGGYAKVHPEQEATRALTPLEEEQLMADIEYRRAQIQNLQNQGQLTPQSMAELDLANRQLEAQLWQVGLANQADMTNIEMMRERYYNEFYTAQQGLALQGAEWYAGLQAQPANWIERWYAEHLPQGAEMPAGLGGAAYPEWLKPMQYQPPQFTMPSMPQMPQMPQQQVSQGPQINWQPPPAPAPAPIKEPSYYGGWTPEMGPGW